MTLPTIHLPKTISPLASSDAQRIDRMHNAVEILGFRDCRFRSAERAPTASERAMLNQRRAQLQHALSPASEHTITVEISGLHLTMISPNASQSEQLALLRAYRSDLLGLPAFALIEACKRFRTGHAGGKTETAGKFMPRIGEVRQLAESIALPFRQELRKIESILSATVPAAKAESAEHRKAVVDRLIRRAAKPLIDSTVLPTNELARGFVHYSAPVKPKQTIENICTRHAAEGPCVLSPAALSTLGKQEPAPERAA